MNINSILQCRIKTHGLITNYISDSAALILITSFFDYEVCKFNYGRCKEGKIIFLSRQTKKKTKKLLSMPVLVCTKHHRVNDAVYTHLFSNASCSFQIMGKFMKSGKVVLVLGGRFAGRKAVIVKV